MDPKSFVSRKAGKPILSPLGFWAFSPNPLPPELDWSNSLVSMVSEAERDLSRLSSLIQAFPFPRLLIQPFIRCEAVISSRIEGTRASLEDVYAYESTQLSFLESTSDAQEVYNYVRALNYGLERLNTLPVSLRFIRELHEKLMENVRGGLLSPGEFRHSQNWIGPVGSTVTTAPFVPPPFEEMRRALGDLEKFIHTSTDIPALIRAGLVHYQFESIHPFLDGNGRVGRLLIILLLKEWDLLPQPLLNISAYIDRYRQEYYDLLLGVSREGLWEAWLSFFLRGISEQARDGVNRMRWLEEIRSKYQPHIDAARNRDRMAAVVDYLFTRPILSINQLSEGVKIPFKTAQSYLVKLQEMGIMREITGFARNRIYQADEILRALQEKDGLNR